MAEQKPVRWYMQVKGTVPIIFERGAGQRFPVAAVEPLYENNSGAERQARGRLIAAAPEMAEMLQELEWVLESARGEELLCCPSCRTIQIEGGHVEACKLKTLIAKIDGRES